MSFFGAGAASSTLGASSSAAATERDIEVSDPPDDSISCLEFCPVADYLAVGSWNNQVRIYEVAANGQTQGKAMYQHEGPVLSVCWNKDGNKIFSGGADKAGRAFDVSTGQSTQVAQHDAPIKCVKWIEAPTGGILATGSWDKTVKYWDLRSPNPVGTVTLPERCYTMDVQYPLMVVGTAERHIQIFNLTAPTTVFKSMTSPLKWQTRVVSCFPAANGFAVGSIEGRVAIQYVEDRDSSQNFSFKCHRKDQTKDQTLVYSVNDISFHQGYGTFSTAGSDGTINFWDKDARSRIKPFDPAPGPITATGFNRTGNIFAYAVSYDWAKGHVGMTQGHINKVMLHACKDDEVKKRPKK